jgi:hypothetical protein
MCPTKLFANAPFKFSEDPFSQNESVSSVVRACSDFPIYTVDAFMRNAINELIFHKRID